MNDLSGKVLVTGGAGYIGSAVVGRLLREGCQVRVLDSFLFGGRSILNFLADNKFEFIHGDIRSEHDVERSLQDVRHVIHLAAIVGDPACAQNNQAAHEVNIDAAQLLLGKAIENGVERFIFSSTCSNYGKMTDPDGFVYEGSELRPVSLYAEQKVAFEKTLMSLSYPNFTPVILRFATAYGLSPRPRFDLTVNEFTRELVLGRTLEVYGGQFWRPYAHIADLAEACLLTLKSERSLVASEAFNVGDNFENYQKKTIVDLVLEQLPSAREYVRKVRKDEDPRDYRVNFDKIQSRLGFRITRRVPDGIREIILAIRSGMISDPDNPQYRNS